MVKPGTYLGGLQMLGKSVIPPSALDSLVGESFASLLNDPVLQFGVLALILGAVSLRIISGGRR
jgi:hypothetical protein